MPFNAKDYKLKILFSDRPDEGMFEQWRMTTPEDEQARVKGFIDTGFAYYAELLDGPVIQDLVVSEQGPFFVGPGDDGDALAIEAERNAKRELRRQLRRMGFSDSRIRRAFKDADRMLP